MKHNLLLFCVVALAGLCLLSVSLPSFFQSYAAAATAVALALLLAAAAVHLILHQSVKDSARDAQLNITGEIEKVMQAFRNGDPGQRLTVSADNAHIAHHLNDIFATFEYVVEREKSFTSNAAHEFKTPLAELLSTIDLAQRKQRRPEEYVAILDKIAIICKRMHHMHDNVLALARSDQGMITTERKPYSIRQALHVARKPFTAALTDKGVELHIDCPQDYRLNRGKDKLHMVFTNLFSNITAYIDDHGQASVKVSRDVSGLGISFINSGCSLQPDDAIKTLDPFWRHGPDEHMGKRHLGVGLNMCSRILTALNGSIKIRISNKGVFYANIFLPADLIIESGSESIQRSAPSSARG